MNVSKFQLPVLLLSFLLLVGACKKAAINKSDSLSNIPQDVSSVISLDIPSLMEKADFEAVKQMDFYKDMLKEVEAENPEMVKFLENPEASGIDLTKPAYFSVYVNPESIEDISVAMTASIADVNAFKGMLKNADKEPEQFDGFTYLGDEETGLAYNDQLMVFGFISDDMTPEDFFNKFFTATPETSIANNANLQKVLKEDHDISLWFSSNAIAENQKTQFAASMANIDAASLKDNFIYSSADFEKGKVVANSLWDLKSGLTKDIDQLFKDKPSKDLTKYIPGGNLAFVMSNALDLEGLNVVLNKQAMAKNYVDFSMQEYGLTVEDIVRAFGGDIALATYAPEEGSDVAHGLFITTIKQQDVFDKFLNLAIERQIVTKVKDNYYQLNNIFINNMARSMPYGSNGGIHDEGWVLIKDNTIFISGDESILSDIENGKVGKKLDGSVAKMLKNNLFAYYMDFVTGGAMMEEFSNQYEELTFMQTAVEREGSEFLMEMRDKNMNSLKKIFELINKDYVEQGGDRIEM
jgi:hypothetical protein